MKLANSVVRAGGLAAALMTSACLIDFPGMRGENPDYDPDMGPSDSGADSQRPRPDTGLPEGCELVEVVAVCKEIGARAMRGPEHNCCPDGYVEVGECEDTEDCHCCVPTETEKADVGGDTTEDDAAVPVEQADAAGLPTEDPDLGPKDKPDAADQMPDAAGLPTPDASNQTPDAAGLPTPDAADLPTPDAGGVCGDNVVVPGHSFVRCGEAGVPDAVAPGDAAPAPGVDAGPNGDSAVADASTPVTDGPPVEPPADARVNPADAVLPVDARILPPDAMVGPVEICNDEIDNDEDGLNNCDDADCAEAAAVTVTFGQDGAELTMFGQPPEIIEGQTTKILSCENFNLGIPFNALLNPRDASVEARIQVRMRVAGNIATGLWMFRPEEDVMFHNAGQQPQGRADIAIRAGAWQDPNAFEAYFPYSLPR